MIKTQLFLDAAVQEIYQNIIKTKLGKLDKRSFEMLFQFSEKIIATSHYYKKENNIIRPKFSKRGIIIFHENFLYFFKSSNNICADSLLLVLYTRTSYIAFHKDSVGSIESIFISNALECIRIEAPKVCLEDEFPCLFKNFVYFEKDPRCIPSTYLTQTSFYQICELINEPDQTRNLAKKLNKRNLFKNSRRLEHLVNEIYTTCKIYHPQVPRIAKILETSLDVYLIYDVKIEKNNQNEIIFLDSLLELNSIESLKMFLSVANCLSQIVVDNIYHHNLDKHAIFLNKFNGILNMGDPKIIGFQNYSDKTFNLNYELAKNSNDLYYLPPEIILHMQPIDITNIDTFSLGILLFELLNIQPNIQAPILSCYKNNKYWEFDSSQINSDILPCISRILKILLEKQNNRLSTVNIFNAIKNELDSSFLQLMEELNHEEKHGCNELYFKAKFLCHLNNKFPNKQLINDKLKNEKKENDEESIISELASSFSNPQNYKPCTTVEGNNKYDHSYTFGNYTKIQKSVHTTNSPFVDNSDITNKVTSTNLFTIEEIKSKIFNSQIKVALLDENDLLKLLDKKNSSIFESNQLRNSVSTVG